MTSVDTVECGKEKNSHPYSELQWKACCQRPPVSRRNAQQPLLETTPVPASLRTPNQTSATMIKLTVTETYTQ